MANYCKQCGAPLKEGARFCSKCGASLNEVSSSGKDVKIPEAPIFSKPLPGLRQSGFNGNAEGTVLLGRTSPSLKEDTDILGSMGQLSNPRSSVKKGELKLSLAEMLRGCSKVIDFGTGSRYELVIPPGLNPGDVIKVKDTGIIDSESLSECEIELTTVIG